MSNPEQWGKVALAALKRKRETLGDSDPKSSTSSLLKEQTSFKAPVHCELSLVLHFLSKDVQGTSPPLPYIGLSKPPCSVCWSFLHTLLGRRLWFFTRTTHGKTPFLWKFPDSELTRSLYRRSFATIYQKLYADLADRYAECILERRPRHSMAPEEYRKYYWELFGEMPEVVP